jgi:hypothetical protein
MIAWDLFIAVICPSNSAFFNFWSVTTVANLITLNGFPFKSKIGL